MRREGKRRRGNGEEEEAEEAAGSIGKDRGTRERWSRRAGEGVRGELHREHIPA